MTDNVGKLIQAGEIDTGDIIPSVRIKDIT